MIDVPTLVLHHTGDPVVPVARGALPRRAHSRRALVELPGDVHVGPESAAARRSMAEFLTGERREAEPDRVLATVLFTDIVGSTERAVRARRRAVARSCSDRHDDIARREIAAARGRRGEVDRRRLPRGVRRSGTRGALRAGDGPAAVDGLGLEIRAGLHTGECELRGDDVAGIAVHLGARIGALAGPGEVLVSSTVRDLTLGSGIEFADRGRH